MLRSWPLWVAALWWGSLTSVGFFVVPLLFVHLPTPAMAGYMAAQLFSAQCLLSLTLAVLLLAASRVGDGATGMARRCQAALPFVLGGALLALLLEFGVAPRIVARQNPALWHNVGSALYLLQWLCAGVALWRVGVQAAADASGTEAAASSR